MCGKKKAKKTGERLKTVSIDKNRMTGFAASGIIREMCLCFLFFSVLFS